MHKRFLLLLLLFIPLLADAQRRGRYRWEVGLDLGAANILGDLGGANQIGTNGFKDLEVILTRPSLGVHARYRKARYFGYKMNFLYGKVSGDDKLTQERFRNNRNIHFKSNIFELSTQLEFYFTKERPGHLYKYKSIKGWKHIDMQVYLFIGAGAFWYNPKAQFQGQWYALQPMGTEGQGIVGNKKRYSRVSVAIPIGIGFKYALDRRWSIGLEYGIRKTFTDYIDDVSTTYYDRDEIFNANGGTAGGTAAYAAYYFADPSLGLIPTVDGVSPTGVGMQRGDSSDNDAYMLVELSINYKIARIRKTKSKF